MRIQDKTGTLHPSPSRISGWREPPNIFSRALPSARTGYRSAIIPNFALKSRFFISLGAPRLKRALLISCILIVVSLSLMSCGSSSSSNKPPSGLNTRVLVSQGVSSPTASPGLLMIDGAKDTPARVGEISAGTSPSFMALSPTKTTLLVYDASNNSNSVSVVNTRTESSTGKVQLTGPSSSMVVPAVTSIGYAAVASAQMNGFSPGAIEVMNLSSGAISDIIGVPNAQTVVANPNGTQLLVFSQDRDTVSMVSPRLA